MVTRGLRGGLLYIGLTPSQWVSSFGVGSGLAFSIGEAFVSTRSRWAQSIDIEREHERARVRGSGCPRLDDRGPRRRFSQSPGMNEFAG